MTNIKDSIASLAKTTIAGYCIPADLHTRLTKTQKSSSYTEISQERLRKLEASVRAGLEEEVAKVYSDKEVARYLVETLIEPGMTLKLINNRYDEPVSAAGLALAYDRRLRGAVGDRDVHALVTEIYRPVIDFMHPLLYRGKASRDNSAISLSIKASDWESTSSASVATPTSISVVTPSPKSMTMPASTSSATPSSAASPLGTTIPSSDEGARFHQSINKFITFISTFQFPADICRALNSAGNEFNELTEEYRKACIDAGYEALRFRLALYINVYGHRGIHTIRKILLEPDVIVALETTVVPAIPPGSLLYLLSTEAHPTNWDPMNALVKRLFEDTQLLDSAFDIVTKYDPTLLGPKKATVDEDYNAAHTGLKRLGLGPVREAPV